MMGMPTKSNDLLAARIAYGRLLRLSAELPATAGLEERWDLLMAMHVAGQGVLRPHWDSHVRMLRLALETGDRREAFGQLLRLALVPLGHALGRLPWGNVGRATVSAFRAMEPPERVRVLLQKAGCS